MSTGRILLTGSRACTSKATVIRALSDASALIPTGVKIVLVHGACEVGGKPAGADALADEVWREWVKIWPGQFEDPETHPARLFRTPLVRNQHMVDLGAAVCVAIADSWASGTGHCARRARAAGIRVLDYGVDTSVEARPGVAA